MKKKNRALALVRFTYDMSSGASHPAGGEGNGRVTPIPRLGATGLFLLERSLPPSQGMVLDDRHLPQQRARVQRIVDQRNERLAAARQLREASKKDLDELEDRSV